MTRTMNELAAEFIAYAAKLEDDLAAAKHRVSVLEAENADLLDERHEQLNTIAELQSRRVARVA